MYLNVPNKVAKELGPDTAVARDDVEGAVT